MSSAPSAKRRFKFILNTLLGVLIFAVLVAFSFYTYLRSESFNRLASEQITKALRDYGMRAEIGKTSISVFDEQAQLRDLKIYNSLTGQPIAFIKSVGVSVDVHDPYALKFSREISVTNIDLDGVEIFVNINSQGKSNFDGLHGKPTKSEAIKTDFSKLIASLDDSAVHFTDEGSKVSFDLDNLKIDAKPYRIHPVMLELNIESEGGRLVMDKRESKIKRTNITGRLDAAGIAVDKLKVETNLANLTGIGSVKDWTAIKYELDFTTEANLVNTSALFFPQVPFKGGATIKGKFSGIGKTYNITGDIASNQLSFLDTDYRNVKLTNFNVNGIGKDVKFGSKHVRVESLQINDVKITGASADNATGEYHHGKTEIKSTIANVSQVEWHTGKLTEGTVNNPVFTISDGSSKYLVTGDSLLKGGEITEIPFNNAMGKVSFDGNVLTLAELKTESMGGYVNGELQIAVDRGGKGLGKAAFSNISTKEVFTVFSGNTDKKIDIPVNGVMTGEAQFSFLTGNADSLTATANAHIEGTSEQHGVQIKGDTSITAHNGVINVNNFAINTGTTNITASGALGISSGSNLHFTLTSSEAAELVRIASSIEFLRPYITTYEPQLIGELKFDGKITGSLLNNPALEGDLSIAMTGMRDAILGSLTTHIAVTGTEFRLEKGLISESEGGQIAFNLAIPTDAKAVTGNLDANITKISLEILLAAIGSPNAEQFISGKVGGQVHLTGLPAAASGEAKIKLDDALLSQKPAKNAEVELKFDGKEASIVRLDLATGDSSITANGKLNLETYEFKVQIMGDKLALESIPTAFELQNTALTGSANVDLIVSGIMKIDKKPKLDWDSLQLFLVAEGKDVRLNGRSVGTLRLGARTTPEGRLDFGLITGILTTGKTSTATDKPEILRGNIELRQPGIPVKIASDLKNQNISPIIEIFAPKLSSSLKGTLTGQLNLAGPILDSKGELSFNRIRGGFAVSQLDMETEGVPVKIQMPLTIALESNQLKIDETRITSEGADLLLSGLIGFEKTSTLDFTLKGNIEPGKLPFTPPDTTMLGMITIDTHLTGTVDDPSLTGSIGISNFGYQSTDSPIFFNDGNGTIKFTGSEIVMDNFTAQLNDGVTKIKGLAKLDKLAPVEWNYEISVTDASIDISDIVARASGNFTLKGTPQGQILSGLITVPQANYTPSIDLDNLFAGGSTGLSFAGSGEGRFLPLRRYGVPPITLDIRADAKEMIVQNSQFNAVGTAIINLRGGINNPDATGRIQSDSGTVRFRGQRYEIIDAYLDFPSGNAEPNLKIQTEATISGTLVRLGIDGPIDNLNPPSLTSEPALSRDEILSLIATGRVDSGNSSSTGLIQSGAGTAAASILSTGFISAPTQRLLGLSRFQLDPVMRANSNPAARLTIGQQLRRNLYATYSTNLASEQDRYASAEYQFTNRFSGIVTFTDGGSSAGQGADRETGIFEVRGRKRFSLGFDPVLPSVTEKEKREKANGGKQPQLPQTIVRVSPVPNVKLNDKRLKELLPIIDQGFSRTLAGLGEQRLREYLQEQGYFFAEVKYRCAPANCSYNGNSNGNGKSGENGKNRASGNNAPPIEVFYDIEPNNIYELKDIRIEGTQLVKFADVKGELQSKTATSLGGVPFIKDLPYVGGYVRGLTSTQRLRADEETLRRQMREMGFRNAKVDSRLAVKPDNDELIVIFNIEEGKQSDIAAVKVRGNTLLTAKEVEDVVPIRSGEAFSFSRARFGSQKIERLYAEYGFLDTKTNMTIEEEDDDSLILIYNVEEGERARVGSIEITGLTKTGVGWVRRYLDFTVGDLLTPDKISTTQRDLYATNAFREVTIRTEKMDSPDGNNARVILQLTESKPLLLTYGAGYSTDDGVRGLMEIVNSNLGGTLDTLGLRLRGSKYQQFAQLFFTDMRPFGAKLPTTFSTFYNRNTNLQPYVRAKIIQTDGTTKTDDSNANYEIERYAAFVQSEKKWSERTSIRFKYQLEFSEASLSDAVAVTQGTGFDVIRAEPKTRITLLGLGFTHDKRDSIINPTKGWLVSGDHSFAATFLGGKESFNKFFGSFQTYKTLDKDFPILKDTTFAFSARVGLAGLYRKVDRRTQQSLPTNIDCDSADVGTNCQLPISERFFTGGATTLRGFRFEAAGPQGFLATRTPPPCGVGVQPIDPKAEGPQPVCSLPTLVPLGGDALTVFNFEIRYPLTQKLRLVPFYDLGNSFQYVTGPNGINWRNMTNSVGMGLRINTPVGPIGVDYGFLIDPPAWTVPITGARIVQPRGAFHIRFGQSF